jgi:polyhydroxyalkanoate synthase
MAYSLTKGLCNAQKALFDEPFKMWQRWLALTNLPHLAANSRLGTTPHDIVYQVDTLRLLRYRNPTVAFREPILVCSTLINRPYLLDLRPQRSVVAQLLKRGFEVYLIDWGVPTAADRGLGLRDYVCDLLAGAARFVRRQAGLPACHLLGYCLGGTLAALYTSLYPDTVRTLTLVAAPLDFSDDAGLLQTWTREKSFPLDRLLDSYGNCPGLLVQAILCLMEPVQNTVEKYLSLWANFQDEDYLEDFFALERWASDDVPLAGAICREIVKRLYQRNELVRGELRLGERAVHPENITCPLLLLTADFDRLVPPASTLGIVPHAGSRDVTRMSLHAGQGGLVISSRAHRQFWPEVAGWLAERSTPARPGPLPSSREEQSCKSTAGSH